MLKAQVGCIRVRHRSWAVSSQRSAHSHIDGEPLTSSDGFIMGYAWKLVLKKPIQKKVVFLARDGKVSLTISAAWSLPYGVRQLLSLLKSWPGISAYIEVRDECVRKLLASG